MKQYCVYLHTNKTNDKKYVGETNHYKRRWTSERNSAFNPNDPGYNYLLSRAIRKYKWDGFTHEVLEWFDTEREALEAEDRWVQFFECDISRYGQNAGYNMKPGGNRAGYKHSEQAKGRMAKARTGVKVSEETRARMSSAQLELHANNRPLSEEQMLEIRASDLSSTKLAELYGVSYTTIIKYRGPRTKEQIQATRTASLKEYAKTHPRKPVSSKTRAKISAANKGKPGQMGMLGKFKLTYEQIKEVQLSSLSNNKLATIYNVDSATIRRYRGGNIADDENSRRLSEGHIGKKHSEETKAKMRASKLGKPSRKLTTQQIRTIQRSKKSTKELVKLYKVCPSNITKIRRKYRLANQT